MKISNFNGVGVSAEALRERRLIESKGFFLAAWCLLGLLFAQLPLGVTAWYLYDREDASKRAAGDAQRALGAVAGREKSQSGLRGQLAQVKVWEGLSQARLPVAPVMAAIESGIPSEIALSRFRLGVAEADGSGELRVPRGYTLEIAGWQRTGDQVELGRWANAVSGILPKGTTMSPLEFRSGAGNQPNSFRLTFTVPPPTTDDLLRLGLRQINIGTR